jgi:hypothetical protein
MDRRTARCGGGRITTVVNNDRGGARTVKAGEYGPDTLSWRIGRAPDHALLLGILLRPATSRPTSSYLPC